MDIDVLEDIGLTKGEIKVYLALLELGGGSAGAIKKRTGLQNSVVHMCLNNLIQKGLVNYVEKGKRRFYSATAPEHLIDFLEEKKRRLQDLLPKLIEKQKEKVEYQVHIYEGQKGLKAIHEDILKELGKDEEFLVMAAPVEAHEKFEAFLLDFHKRRQKKGIGLRCIYKKESKKYAEVRRGMKNTQIKYLPMELTAPMWVTIYKNKTILIVVGNITLGILIENKTIADNFKEYFELIWKISKDQTR